MCSTRVASPAKCFEAVKALGLLPIVKNLTQTSTTVPQGCYVMSTQDGYEAFYNTAPSTAQCGPAATAGPVRSTGSETEQTSGVSVGIDLDEGAGNCSSVTADLSGTWSYDGRPYGKGGKGGKASPYSVIFKAITSKPGFYSVLPGDGEVEEYKSMNTGVCSSGCEAHVVGHQLSMSGGFTMEATVGPNFTSITFTNGAPWTRSAKVCDGLAIITLEGPSSAWFGVGFDSVAMADTPYAIIVAGTGAVTERRMANHAAGDLLPASVRIVSSTVASNRRTVVVSRSLKGATPQHLTFDATASGIPFIAAVGTGPVLGYHKARGGGALMLVEAGAPLCVCPSFGTASGSIDGVRFNKKCAPMPRSSLLEEHNDICSIESYHGGLASVPFHHLLLVWHSFTRVPTQDTWRSYSPSSVPGCCTHDRPAARTRASCWTATRRSPTSATRTG